MKDIAVEYLGGSGFLVSLGDIGMLFDASEHGGDSRLLPDREKLAAYRRLYVFVSHRHDDHFSESIYDLCGSEAIYIVGFDLPQPHRGVRMEPGEERGFGPVQVKAFGSTDEGVSFLVEMAGITLFHAGDLNLWHWRDESSITEIEAAESAFYACVEPIPKQAIDVAFFPVDPRQGSMYDAGAGYFIMTVKPKIMIPMHFQGRADVAVRFASVGSTPQTQVIAMTEPGERIDLTLPETDESAPDRRLRELLEDASFGELPDDMPAQQDEDAAEDADHEIIREEENPAEDQEADREADQNQATDQEVNQEADAEETQDTQDAAGTEDEAIAGSEAETETEAETPHEEDRQADESSSS